MEARNLIAKRVALADFRELLMEHYPTIWNKRTDDDVIQRAAKLLHDVTRERLSTAEAVIYSAIGTRALERITERR
jgi:hypothetical protein